MPKRTAFVVSLGLLFGVATPALAVPAFARRYDVACHFCHEGYPKLNLMGQRFKERGFRMEKEDPFDFNTWIRTVPVTARVIGTQFFFEDSDDGAVGFIKPISAGSLGRRFAYWVDWGYIIRSDIFTPEGEENAEFTDVDNAWGRVEVVGDGKLYVRGGRFEMDLPFTQTRSPHLFSYDILNVTTGFESDNIASFQDGVEVGGDLPSDLHWSAAAVKGRDSEFVEDLDADDTEKFEANVFLRLARRWGRHRFGAFSYIGRNHLVLPTGGPSWKDDLLRIGVDGSVWVRRLNLYGVAMYGRDSNPIATPAQPQGTGQALDFSGGFLQADWNVRDDLALTARLNVVSRPQGTSPERQTFTSVFPGVQFYILERLKLSAEYGFQNRDRPGLGAVQAELAF